MIAKQKASSVLRLSVFYLNYLKILEWLIGHQEYITSNNTKTLRRKYSTSQNTAECTSYYIYCKSLKLIILSTYITILKIYVFQRTLMIVYKMNDRAGARLCQKLFYILNYFVSKQITYFSVHWKVNYFLESQKRIINSAALYSFTLYLSQEKGNRPL